MFREHQERRFHLVSVRLVNHSEMRLHQVTSHSEQENLSRWNLSSSANLAQTLSGSDIGESIASTGLKLSVSRMMRCVQETIHQKNSVSTAREQQILNSYSHLDGVNSGVSLTEQIMTLLSIRQYQGRICHILMMSQKKNISHMLLSHHSVQTELHLLSFVQHMMKRNLRAAMWEQFFISILLLHLLRLVFFHFLRS